MLRRVRWIVLLALVLAASVASSAYGLVAGPQDVFVRVIDSGAALSCVVKMPNDTYMIYDAGNYTDDGARTFAGISEIIPSGKAIELLVLSHSDSDHLGAVDEICDTYTVRRVIQSGYERTFGTWQDADQAIKTEKANEKCIDINLRYVEYPAGATYRFGDVMVQMVAGFHKPPSDWGPLDQSEERNAGSIVVRLIYKGKSILFGGDTVGRHIGQADDSAIAAEQFMIRNADVISLDSEVMIAPHHGADNASSTPFIKRVSPEFVIFSAGHKYGHPRGVTAQRYLDAGVPLANIYRTDLGDDEGDEEWSFGRRPGAQDPPGDDDVDVVLRVNGTAEVAYRGPANQQYHQTLTGP